MGELAVYSERIYIDGITFMSLNRLWSMHRNARQRYFNELKERAYELWTAQWKVPMENMVEFEFQHVSPSGKLFDADNYVGMTKAVMDAAVQAGFIRDDGPKFVNRVILNAGRRPTKNENVKSSLLIAEIRELYDGT